MFGEGDFAGKWNIVEALDMADDYLDLTPIPCILIDSAVDFLF